MTTGPRHIDRADLLLRAANAIALSDEDRAHLRSCIACRHEYDAIETALADRRRTEAVVTARTGAEWDRKRAEILALIRDRAAHDREATATRFGWRSVAVAASLLAVIVIPTTLEITRGRRVVAPAVERRTDAPPATSGERRRVEADDEWLRELTRLADGTEDEGSWRALAPLPPQEGDDR